MRQTRADIIAANGALLEKFLQQLASLIGESLTERLLHAVVDIHSTGDRVGVIDTRALNVSVDEISMLLIAEIERLRATRVVIDSLSGFELALPPTFRADYRESLARMVSALAATGATVLMTCELEDRYEDLRSSPYGTAFLTDAQCRRSQPR